MTYTDLVAAVTSLPRDERRALLAVLARSLEEDAVPSAPPAVERGWFDPTRSALDQLRGIARPAGPAPTDDEVDALIADALNDKYR